MRIKALQAVAALDERVGQAVQKLVVGRRVGVAEVVHRLDDAPADQVKPDPVDQAAGEERVLGAGQPGGQADPTVGAWDPRAPGPPSALGFIT